MNYYTITDTLSIKQKKAGNKDEYLHKLTNNHFKTKEEAGATCFAVQAVFKKPNLIVQKSQRITELEGQILELKMKHTINITEIQDMYQHKITALTLGLIVSISIAILALLSYATQRLY